MPPYFTLESNRACSKTSFSILQARLITLVNLRVYNGEFTERGLARVTKISQPHLHNVLKLTRKLKIELADRLMDKFGICVLDLFETAELSDEIESRKKRLSARA